MKFKKVELHAFRAYKDKQDGTFDFTLDDDKIADFVSIYAPPMDLVKLLFMMV